MYIPLAEPVSPRYIYINPDTNKMHLLVPIVGGEEISTDNTCKAIIALREFFDGGALHELITYKKALLLDLTLLGEGHPAYAPKKERLEQIEFYITAVSAMKNHYGQSIDALLKKHLIYTPFNCGHAYPIQFLTLLIHYSLLSEEMISKETLFRPCIMQCMQLIPKLKSHNLLCKLP